MKQTMSLESFKRRKSNVSNSDRSKSSDWLHSRRFHRCNDCCILLREGPAIAWAGSLFMEQLMELSRRHVGKFTAEVWLFLHVLQSGGNSFDLYLPSWHFLQHSLHKLYFFTPKNKEAAGALKFLFCSCKLTVLPKYLFTGSNAKIQQWKTERSSTNEKKKHLDYEPKITIVQHICVVAICVLLYCWQTRTKRYKLLCRLQL